MTRVLGRYEAWGRLSQGGMSEVWLARHDALAMPAVIKTIRPEIAAAVPESETMLVGTARMVARLASPHAVRVLDAGSAVMPGSEAVVPCVIEEYVDGLDLAELDRRRRQSLGRSLPLWAVCELAADAASGLHAAHQSGVIHRDIKPANLFCDHHGAVKVGDFGIAIAAHGERDTRPAGTPHFMPPEQLVGERCDRRSDVFSLGATAFALRYGQPPWASTGELRSAAPPRFPPARTAEEASFQHVIEHAMARKLEARPASAHLVEVALRRIAQGIRPALAPVRLGPGLFAIGDTRISLEVGDLAETACDAIVTSAYHDMSMSSGVGKALKARGGAIVEEQAMANGERALGDCVVTTAGDLPCRAVLHAVGAWKEVSCIARATWRAILTAEASGWQTIAMPAIGTGRGQVALAACADTLGAVLRLHLMLGGSKLREARVVLYDAHSLRAFEEVLSGLFLGADRARDEEASVPDDAWDGATVFASERERR